MLVTEANKKLVRKLNSYDAVTNRLVISN